jgi:16S rRNA (cytosine967-C5)-methyltransferase
MPQNSRVYSAKVHYEAVTGEKPREIAARILCAPRAQTDFLETRLERALARASLTSADRRLCQELVYGVVRWQATLDWLIARKTEGRTQKAALQALLRLGLYQLFWLDRIPDHAAVDETVTLAKQFGFGPQAGFVNAVLRSYVREQAATRTRLKELKMTQPHLGFSHPAWLLERWTRRWDAERTRGLLEWNNTPPKTYARLNTLRTDGPKLIAQWRAEDVEYEFRGWDWTGENLVFELKAHPPLARLATFQQGCFYIQDPSTLLAVRELNPQPGETILDLCAAPGGKTTYIAQLMENRGRIVAQDHSLERLKLLQDNCARLGVTCVAAELTTSDATCHVRPLTFDRVLVDAPCSNTGVLRRRVELRWRLRQEEIDRLRATQLELLRRGAGQLKPGGTLVYSTCSLEPEENGEAVKAFRSEHRDFRLERERELLPFADGVDGVYVAGLIKAPAV